MQTRPRSASAFDLLHRDILNGVYAPGQPLRIAALSATYRLSATPLREALSRLEAQALVVAEANRGWRVAPVSLAEFEDLQAARRVLERSLLEDAIAQGGLDWESGIVAAHYRLAQTPAPVGAADTPDNRAGWIAAHDGFHTALLAAARSGWLKAFHGQTIAQLRRHHQALLFAASVRDGPQDAARKDAALAEALSVPPHTALMQVVLRRDRAAALAALDAHVDATITLHRSLAAPVPMPPADPATAPFSLVSQP